MSLREYLARAVSKATGAHNLPLVTPNHRPIFSPMQSEATSASLEAQGEVLFRHHPTTMYGAPAVITPLQRGDDEGVLIGNLETAAGSSLHAQHRPAGELRKPVKVSNRAAMSQITERDTAHAAAPNARVAEMRVIADATHDGGSQQTSTNEMAAVTLQNQDSPKNAMPTNEIGVRQIVSQRIGPSTAHELNEGAEVKQPTPRQDFYSEESYPPTQETAVQVRIGRIEVRTAAPPPISAPAAPKRQGPRGFSEYEAVRRYLPRSRR